MSKVLVSENILDDTASALQGKLGTTDKFTPTQFASGIESIPTNTFLEITDNNSTSLSKYTANELINRGKTAKGFTFRGAVVISFTTDVSDHSFEFKYTANGFGNLISIMTARVYYDKRIVIDWSAEENIAYSVNNKLGNITLYAGDIQADTGWTPTNAEDLATKGYVDSVAGSLPTYEIVDTSALNTSNYTGAELKELVGKCILTHRGKPILAYNNSTTSFQYAFLNAKYVGGAEGFIVNYVSYYYVNDSVKTLVPGDVTHPNVVPLSVNGRKADVDTGEITVYANDIVATNAYNPSSSNSIATKGYVDSKISSDANGYYFEV